MLEHRRQSARRSNGDGLGSASAYWTTWSYNGVLGTTTSQDQHSLTGGSDTVTADSYGGTGGGPDALTSAATTGGSTSTSTFGYDSAGNMTSRSTPASGAQTLTWAADGKLASVTGSGGATSYVDDAGGNLLLQQNPGSTTVYLPGEQLTATSSGSVTGARIIALPSGGDVVRTGATTSYHFEVPDQHGTNDLELDNTAQVPAWRQFTPYGAPRGTAVTWADNRAFLNQPADTATGLTYDGARAYDPVTGQFISPDPILNPGDPQDLNPYAYAQDNPVTNSDPTGLLAVYGNGSPDSGCTGTAQACAPILQNQATGNGSGTGTGPGYGSTYNPYSCGRFGLSCGNFQPQQDAHESGGFSLGHWLVHTALPWVGHHWQDELEVAGLGVCILASAGACLIAGGVYTAASYIAAVHDAHWNFAKKGALTGLGENLIATVLMGYYGKMVGGVLSSTSAEEVAKAFNPGSDLWGLPYLTTDIGERAIIKPDYVSTAHQLINNIFWATAGCFSSFSWPCTAS